MAIELEPRNGLAFGNRGIARRNKGDTEAAIADFNVALKILGKDLSFIKQRAICYRLVQDYDRALADYNDAIELDPKNADLLYQRSRVWMRKNDQVRRLADIADALKIEPGNVTFQTAFMEASGESSLFRSLATVALLFGCSMQQKFYFDCSFSFFLTLFGSQKIALKSLFALGSCAITACIFAHRRNNSVAGRADDRFVALDGSS
jgi:tetratricopeptide (TPR) repeat protein